MKRKCVHVTHDDTVIASFATVAEAEAFIAGRESADPVGVRRGDYGIDAPEVVQPKRGMTFLHARAVDPDTRQPMLYRITYVRDGYVYYRPVDSKEADLYATIKNFPFWVLRWVK
jgi:hypothetical protein